MTTVLLDSFQVVSSDVHLTDRSGREVKDEIAVLANTVVHADDVFLGVVLVEGIHHMSHDVFFGDCAIDIGDDDLGVVVEKIARSEVSTV